MTAILPLSALGDVDWASLEHAYGEAVDVPETLRAIAGGDPAQRAQARSWLHACLDHQGVQRGEATLRAVPYLLGLIADAAVAERGAIAGLVAELAVGDTCWFLHDGFHPDLQPNPDDCARAQHAAYLTGGDIQIRSFPSPGGSLDMTPGHGLRELYEAIAAGTPQLVAALDDADPEVREGVAFLLGFLTTRADATAPALARLLAADPEARVRASAALGLSHAAKRSPS
ncbi:MAG: HEAT repeat domain-containing protein, partial [Myxococcales bacterium]|nr:HEAT repeat domain-containing protein [Myxococcales bacterium]